MQATSAASRSRDTERPSEHVSVQSRSTKTKRKEKKHPNPRQTRFASASNSDKWSRKAALSPLDACHVLVARNLRPTAPTCFVFIVLTVPYYIWKCYGPCLHEVTTGRRTVNAFRTGTHLIFLGGCAYRILDCLVVFCNRQAEGTTKTTRLGTAIHGRTLF